MAAENTWPFDWTFYGVLVRKSRMDMGYRKAGDFASTLYRRTRVSMSRDVLYKIEQGRQVPKAEEFMALNIALWGSPCPDAIFGVCASKEWRDIKDAYGNWASGQSFPFSYDAEDSPANAPQLPDAWKKENTQEVLKLLSPLKETTTPDGFPDFEVIDADEVRLYSASQVCDAAGECSEALFTDAIEALR